MNIELEAAEGPNSTPPNVHRLKKFPFIFQAAPGKQDRVVISSRRFEESPFIERTYSPDMVRGVYAGRFYPFFMDEDYIDKYWCLRQKALIFDVPEKPIEIAGPDAVSFLDKVLSRNVANMAEGRGYYAIACTPRGGVFMDGVVFRLGKDRFWYVQADGAFETWLAAHCGGFDVSISDPGSRVLQIQGPASIEIMNSASGGVINHSMAYFRSGYFELGGQTVYVSRTGFTNELGFEIYSAGQKTDHIALWDHLIACGEPHGMEFSSSCAMTIRRIEGGILGNLTDINTTMTPFEAGLGDFIDMAKEDFIGREALIGKDKRSLLFGATCASEIPAAGSVLIDGNTEVGSVTAGVPSPTLGLGIGYVRFNFPADWVGRRLSMRISDGDFHAVDIVDLPFFDPDKKIVRGVDRSIPVRND